MIREAELRDKAMKIDHNVFSWIYNQGIDVGITQEKEKWKQAVQKLKKDFQDYRYWEIRNEHIDKIFGELTQ